MSALVREALADAANTVPDIFCTPYFRQTTKAGDAMVRLAGMRRDDSGFGFMNTWQVLVILPQDIESAEKYLETKVPALLTAVGEQLVITTVTPQELIFDNGTSIPAVVIEGAREQE